MYPMLKDWVANDPSRIVSVSPFHGGFLKQADDRHIAFGGTNSHTYVLLPRCVPVVVPFPSAAVPRPGSWTTRLAGRRVRLGKVVE